MKRIVLLLFLFPALVKAQNVDVKQMLLDALHLKETKEKPIIIYITQDADCFSCLGSLASVDTDIVSYGLYYSRKDTKGFLKRLKKLNANIHWVPLSKPDLLKYFYKGEYRGPFQLVLYKGIININLNWWCDSCNKK